MEIDAKRLQKRLDKLANIGRRPGYHGLWRTALSPADRKARQWLLEQFCQAGLQARTDAAGNLIGRLEGESPDTIIIGSHIDTVPDGGPYDGAYGVLAGLECAQALIEAGQPLQHSLEVIAFTDEEGTWSGLLGSRAMTGRLHKDELEELCSREEFVRALDEAGLDCSQLAEAGRDLSQVAAYLEIHVEQGPELWTDNVALGVVTGIVGIHQHWLSWAGKANHAGTTSMERRDDALLKAARFIQELNTWVREEGEMVGTVGQLSVYPGAKNIVPGRVEHAVELRALEVSKLERIRQRIDQYLAGQPGEHQRKLILAEPAAQMHGGIQSLLERACQATGKSCRRMPSGAGHDAANFADQVPTGMLFVPSRDGISHAPEEWSRPVDLALGCQALLNGLQLVDQQL